MTIDNALPGLELDCAPDPCCPIDCEACADLPYGESVRKEQLSLMTTSIHAQEIFTRIMSGPSLTVGSPDVELMTMAMGAIHLASFASVLGMLLKVDPKLAHRAIGIHQEMYSNGDVIYTEQLYVEAEKLHEEHKAKRAERLAAMPKPEPKFLIWSLTHGMWWKPLCSGYTSDLWAAGRYSEADAQRETKVWSLSQLMVLAPENGHAALSLEEIQAAPLLMAERCTAADKARQSEQASPAVTTLTTSEVL